MRKQQKKECIIMMDFIIMTLSFTVAIWLSIAVSCVLMAQPMMLKLYAKYVNKMMKNMDDAFDDVV